MMNSDWIKEISMEDLPDAYSAVAEIIGIENTIKLSQHLGGLAFYFPKLDWLLQKKRDEAIRKEFNGTNHKELAQKHGLSEIWIRQIVQTREEAKQPSLL